MGVGAQRAGNKYCGVSNTTILAADMPNVQVTLLAMTNCIKKHYIAQPFHKNFTYIMSPYHTKPVLLNWSFH